MVEAFVDAYVFGSVAKNKAKSTSDIDIMFVVKKPTREERYFMNTPDEFQKREGIHNFAKNSHHLYLKARELEEKHGIEISYYWCYEEDFPDSPVALNDAAFVPFRNLILEAIPYSRL